MRVVGSILFAIGALLTLLNFYFGFVRYGIHRLCGGTQTNYKFISPIPLFGSLLLWISIPILPSVSLRWVAAILSLFDTGGIHWFVVTTFVAWLVSDRKS